METRETECGERGHMKCIESNQWNGGVGMNTLHGFWCKCRQANEMHLQSAGAWDPVHRLEATQ